MNGTEVVGSIIVALLLLVLSLLVRIMQRITVIESRWEERDRSARERREDWLREAEVRVAAARKGDIAEALAQHAAGCPGRRGGGAGGTNPGIPVYHGPISGDAP